MVQIDKNTIKSLTQLSRIHCGEDEQEKLLHDLQNILSYIEQLEEVSTENVPPCHHVLGEVSNVMREDVVGETMPRELFLANTTSKGGLVLIPPVFPS